jgi:putative ABC transport system permease protein
MVLAGLGGATGMLLAYWMIRLLIPLAPAGLLPAYAQVAVNTRALGFTLGLTLLTGLACGLAPVLRSGTRDLSLALHQGARAASSGLRRLRHPGLQQVLVAGEVALALILLAGAGLMIRSLRERLAVEPGFNPAGVLAARVSLPRNYVPAARTDFVERLVARLNDLPGVDVAAVGTDLPLRGNSNAATLLVEAPGAVPIRHYRHSVTPEFFGALGIPLERGRGFTSFDRENTPRVAVISTVMARRFWPGQDPIGHRFRQGDETGPEVTIVGVAGPARFRDLTTDLAAATSEPDVYYPFSQRTSTDLELAIRMRDGTLASVTTIQREVAALDPGLPLYLVAPLGDALTTQNAAPRFGSLVLGAFSALALLLAAIGIYGVISFVVGLSRKEIAIRLALGADGGKVLRTVMANGMLLVLAGVVVGMIGARLGATLLESQLYGVSASDPGTLTAVSGAVMAVALLASWLPARRAAAVEPQTVLKGE